jgi:hypothetical protein
MQGWHHDVSLLICGGRCTCQGYGMATTTVSGQKCAGNVNHVANGEIACELDGKLFRDWYNCRMTRTNVVVYAFRCCHSATLVAHRHKPHRENARSSDFIERQESHPTVPRMRRFRKKEIPHLPGVIRTFWLLYNFPATRHCSSHRALFAVRPNERL